VSGLHIIGGESISTARTILLNNPAGLSYSSFFAERAITKQYEGKEALQITNSKGKEQILIFVGTSKSNSFASIRGLTAMSVLITEANLAHKSFIQEAIGRTIATDEKYRKLYFDLNPKAANDWFYKDFLDLWQGKSEIGEIMLNYENTTYFDNPALSDEQKLSIKQEYDPESLLYKIYILGQRISQADHVYNIGQQNIIVNPPKPNEYVIVVDPGISSSATTFITQGIVDDTIYVYDMYFHKSGRAIEGPDVKDYRQYAEDLADYYIAQIERYGFAPTHIFLDRDIAFLRMATEVFRSRDLPHNLLKYAIKDKVDDRIRTMGSLLYKGALKVNSELKLVIDAIENAVYDSDKLDEDGELVRLDEPNPNKEIINYIDILDPIEYANSYFIRRMKGILS
jgi:PBSX family phage terminase large subunit